jgi:hypothetical protein
MKKYYYITAILAVIFLSSFCVRVQAMNEPPPTPVRNEEHYKELVMDSSVYDYFDGWELKKLAVDHYYSANSIVNVTLQFDVPDNYSVLGINYSATVVFSYQGDVLVNAYELHNTYGEYKAHLEHFEQISSIRFFIERMNIKNIVHKDPHILEIRSDSKGTNDYIKYNFRELSIQDLRFKDRILIDNIDKYFPGVLDVSQIDTFQKDIKVSEISFDEQIGTYAFYIRRGGELTFVGSEGRILKYDVRFPQFVGFSTNNISFGGNNDDIDRKIFPKIQSAEEILEYFLSNDSSFDCSINKEQPNVNIEYYKSHFGRIDEFAVEFALVCLDKNGSKTHFLRKGFVYFYPNGKFNRVKIDPPVKKSRQWLSFPDSNDIYYWIYIMDVIVMILTPYIMFRIIRKKRK